MAKRRNGQMVTIPNDILDNLVSKHELDRDAIGRVRGFGSWIRRMTSGRDDDE